MRTLKAWLPAAAWAAVILLAANDGLSAEATGDVLDRIFGFSFHPAVNFTIRKLAHVVEYAILALLTFRADRRRIVVLAVALVVATIDETRQGLFTTARSGSPWDVLLDVAGAYTAWFVATRRTRG